MKAITLILLFFSQVSVFGQNSFVNPDSSKIHQWRTDSLKEYEYVFCFYGQNSESILTLIYDNNKWYGQITTNHLTEDENKWITDYENFSYVRIEDNKFYSSKTNGEFVYYDGKDGQMKGLMIFNSWHYVNSSQFGFRFTQSIDQFPGKFPQASYRILNEDEIQKRTKKDLQIMKNEILARYGLIFPSGSKMDKYFTRKCWYCTKHKHYSVIEYLSEIEKKNIELIMKYE